MCSGHKKYRPGDTVSVLGTVKWTHAAGIVAEFPTVGGSAYLSVPYADVATHKPKPFEPRVGKEATWTDLLQRIPTVQRVKVLAIHENHAWVKVIFSHYHENEMNIVPIEWLSAPS